MLLATIIRNGGTKTFLKAVEPKPLLEALAELAQRGEVRRITDSPQTVTYSVLSPPRPENSVSA